MGKTTRLANYALIVLLGSLPIAAFGNPPEWVDRLPFDNEAFYGTGSAARADAARDAARQVILMQLSSQVEAAITMDEHSDAISEQTTEKLTTYVSSNSLRGAREQERYQDNDTVWVLMYYPADCGRRLMESAVQRYADSGEYDPEVLIPNVSSADAVQAMRLKLRLSQLNLEEYQADTIMISLRANRMTIILYDFLPETVELSDKQQTDMRMLSESLLSELQEISYRSLTITGHANPTGIADEKQDLRQLSQGRAEILAGSLREAGLNISEVTWAGGKRPIGDVETEQGRRRNRRVEILVNFE